MKKILFSDYDNTLYKNDESIKNNVKYINKFVKVGNMFSIASGRSYIDIKDELNRYNIPFNYLILNHGATILDNNLNIIKYYIINKDVVKDIYNYINKYNVSYKCIYSKDKKNVNILDNVVKLLYIFNNKDEMIKVKEYIDSKYYSYVKTYISEHIDHITLEIISNLTSKSNGIRFILEKENIKKDNVYVIGDNYNDIEMLLDYNGYGVSNSIENIKNITTKLYDNVSDLIKDII